MVHKNNKKHVIICRIGKTEFQAYDGVDYTGICNDGAFYFLYWCSSGKKLKFPMEHIYWVSEEYEQVEQGDE